MNYKKIIFLVSFLAVFGFLFCLNVPKAQATTVEELQVQIQQLLAQIAALQQQLTQLQGATTTWCHTFNTNLRYGDNGNEVTALQNALEKEGFDINDEEQKGYANFGESTASAVVGFQEKYVSEILAPWGLKHGTGFVGNSTRAKLNKLYGCGVVTTPSITVISPNGGEKWEIGKTYEITWKSSGIEKLNIVLVDFSTGGAGSLACTIRCTEGVACPICESEQKIASDILASSGKYLWTIPANLSLKSTYKIRLYDVNAQTTKIYNESYKNFSIVTAAVACTDSDGSNSYVKGITTGKLGGEGDISTYTDFCADKNWNLMNSCEGSACFLMEYVCQDDKVAKVANYCYYGCKDGACVATTTPSIILISPNGGEKWYTNTVQTVKWSATALSGSLYIYVDQDIDGDGSYERANYITNALASAGQVSFTLPATVLVNEKNKVRILGGTYPYIQDSSDAPFSVVAQSSITVLSPNGGEKWQIGQTYEIKWVASGLSSVGINIANDAINLTTGIADNVSPGTGSYSWTIPSSLAVGDKYKILVGGQKVSDMSNNYFSIVAATTTPLTCSQLKEAPASLSYFGSCKNQGYDRVCFNKYNYEYQGCGKSTLYDDCTVQNANADKNIWCDTGLVYTCNDSDNGKSYYTKGTVTDSGKTYIDYCIDSSTLKEYFCLTSTLFPSGTAGEENYTCPSGCQNGACSAITKPSITVISPNGGEKWTFSIPQTITWNSVGVNNVAIYLWFPDGRTCKIAGADTPAALGKYTVTLQENQQCPSYSSYIIAAGQYKISIWSTDDPNADIGALRDYSDNYFSIVSTTQPFTVTFPSAGATLTQGKTYNLTWSGGDTNITSYSVYLIGGSLGSSGSRFLGVSYSLQKSFSWTVPSDITPGSGYQIQFSGVGASGGNSSSFSIVPVTIACTDSDGGKDYYIKGVGKGLYLGSASGQNWIFGEDPNKASSRYDPTLNYSIYYDHCFNSATSKQLNEAYCTSEGNLGAEGITCPYGCQNGACLPAPSITSFNYTETDAYGGSVKFYWTSTGADGVELQMSCHSGLTITDAITGANFLCGDIDRSLSPNSSTYLKFTNTSGASITVTATLTPVINHIGYGAYSKTLNFSVAPITPSITVTYPKGGETFPKGSSRLINLQFSPYVPLGGFVVNLIRSDTDEAAAHLKYCGTTGYTQDSATPPNVSWTWQVGYDADGKEISNGSYRILVYDCGSKTDSVWTGGVAQTKSNTFTIVSGELGLKNMENQLASIAEAISKLMEQTKNLMGR